MNIITRTIAHPRFLAASLVIAGSFVASAALAQTDGYTEDIKRCLANWEKHPFSASSPKFRTIETKVKVMGIGGNTRDDHVTSQPDLVYIRPNVSVMSKTVVELLNPNGWYCLPTNVSVMAKVHIKLHCNAHLASADEGVTVMGGGTHGVNVMGATQVEMVDCN